MSSDTSQPIPNFGPPSNTAANVNYKTSRNDSLSVYDKLMSSIGNIKTPPLTDLELSKEHDQAVNIAVSCFRGNVTLADKDLSAKLEAEIRTELDKKFEDYKTLNQFKYRNKMEEEKIEKLRKEQELKEKERMELEEALRKIQEQNAKSKESTKKERDEESPEEKSVWVRMKEIVGRYYNPFIQTLIFLTFCCFAFDYVKALK